MADEPESNDRPDRSARRRHITHWAVLGAVSGLAATLSIFVPQWAGLYGGVKSLPFGPALDSLELLISPLSLGPGIAFGLIAGFALRRAGPARGWRYPAFVLASTLSYFAVAQLMVDFWVGVLEDATTLGIAAGLIGAALLTAASAALMPAFRRPLPVVSTIGAGAVLGALLSVAMANQNFLGCLALFAPWQAGYAAAMATALPSQKPALPEAGP